MDECEIHLHWCGDTDEGQDGAADALFPYWSFTKTVLAALWLQEVEAGRADLDADLAGWTFTLRQLLAHQAGLGDYCALPAYQAAVAAEAPAWSGAEMMRQAEGARLRYAPGQGWGYSNIGYYLARELLQDLTGQAFGALVAARITTRLGLQSVFLPQTKQDMARCHWPAAARYDPGWVYHGCLIGSARDAVHLLRAIFDGRLLGAKMQAEMCDLIELGGALEGRPWASHGYGLGLMCGRVDGLGLVVGHSGGGPFSVNSVVHLAEPGRPRATVAAFAPGAREGVAECAAIARMRWLVAG